MSSSTSMGAAAPLGGRAVGVRVEPTAAPNGGPWTARRGRSSGASSARARWRWRAPAILFVLYTSARLRRLPRALADAEAGPRLRLPPADPACTGSTRAVRRPVRARHRAHRPGAQHATARIARRPPPAPLLRARGETYRCSDWSRRPHPCSASIRPGTSTCFGTDKYGRDTFSRLLYGSRVSLVGGAHRHRDHASPSGRCSAGSPATSAARRHGHHARHRAAHVDARRST